MLLEREGVSLKAAGGELGGWIGNWMGAGERTVHPEFFFPVGALDEVFGGEIACCDDLFW